MDETDRVTPQTVVAPADRPGDAPPSGQLRVRTAPGHPLVLGLGGTRLVRPEVAETKMTCVGVHTPLGPPGRSPRRRRAWRLCSPMGASSRCCSRTCTVAQC